MNPSDLTPEQRENWDELMDRVKAAREADSDEFTPLEDV